jgi:hypothetical protein
VTTFRRFRKPPFDRAVDRHNAALERAREGLQAAGAADPAAALREWVSVTMGQAATAVSRMALVDPTTIAAFPPRGAFRYLATIDIERRQLVISYRGDDGAEIRLGHFDADERDQSTMGDWVPSVRT